MESNALEEVSPTSPPAPWIGGKSKLADLIGERLAAIPHKAYAEAFMGLGGVFFRRRWKPKAEVINDVNRELITLFRVLQRHHGVFVDMLRWQLSSRAEFERLQKQDPATLTDLERAARFLYLQRLAFGGKAAGQNFGVSPLETVGFDVTRLIPLLSEIHDRLAGVTIECLGYGEFIKRYDRAGVLFYLDPPYWNSEDDYGRGIFVPRDFERLAHQLAAIEGRFMLSINDVPEIRRIFRAFRLEAVETSYTIAGGEAKRAAELLITNAEERPVGLL